MECTRCQGTMVADQYIDLQAKSVWCEAWRCLNCGDILDSVILRHRTLQHADATIPEAVPVAF